MKLSPQNIISGVILAITLSAASITLNPSSAKAFFSIAIPFPSGIWANVSGKQLFLGDFASRPNPQCPSACSWAVRHNGRLSAHGNGRTPAWVIGLIRQLGR